MKTDSRSEANARQVGGTHYVSEFQHWDFAAAVRMGYFPGVITKYLSRWRKKNGIQDLEKALHYLEKYAELLASWRPAEVVASSPGLFLSVASDFNRVNGFDNSTDEGMVNMVLASSHTVAGVRRCAEAVEAMLQKARGAQVADPDLLACDAAVDAMAYRMKWQLAVRRSQGRSGWAAEPTKYHLEKARSHVSSAIASVGDFGRLLHIAAAANYLAFAAEKSEESAHGPGPGYVNQDR